ncbi:high-affinity nickel-transporter protein [Halomicrococcus sp. NG-SE-24]|uniref:high-affinity nickel-transporter protein n=1 Tax=Halomicrococcus sp. NG-SE-24 TaxID=3436928 RepID=UPI003D9848C4
MVSGVVLVAGAILGIKHALEIDHLAAVTTLVNNDDRPGYIGASWGVGHSLPIITLGVLFVVFGVRLPAAVTKFFEVLVGLVLLYLGAQMLLSSAKNARFDAHAHDDRLHSFRMSSLFFGSAHSHPEQSSFLVGIVHGFAGSGVLVVALVSTAPTVTSALTFLTGFSFLSIVTMAAVSFLWGRIVGTRFTAYLMSAAGIIGIGVGAILLLEQIGLSPL